MKRLIVSLAILVSISVQAKTPEQILKQDGFVLLSREQGKDVYYRPKDVKKDGDVRYYGLTRFFKSGSNKYSLETEYKMMSCKEKKYVLVGLHKVPYMGKASYKDYTKLLTAKDIKALSPVDKKIHTKICRG